MTQEHRIVSDTRTPCPCCGAVPDTHRKDQARHLHIKSEGMVKFIERLQAELNTGSVGFEKMIAAVRKLKQ